MILDIDEFLVQLRSQQSVKSKERTLEISGESIHLRIGVRLQDQIIRTKCTCEYCGKQPSHVFLTKIYCGNKRDIAVEYLAFTVDGSHRHLFKPTTDHVVPKKKGGKNNAENYQFLCDDCNVKKAHSLPSELILGKNWWKELNFDFSKEEIL